jgi:hypothetical protein
MSVAAEREKALSILNANVRALSKLYRECFLSMGRGALLVYAENIIDGKMPSKGSYRTREEMLENSMPSNSCSSFAKAKTACR